MIPAALASRLFVVTLLLVTVTLPFAKNINSWAIGAMAVAWLLEGNFSEKWKRLQNHRWLWVLFAWWALHALALLYTDNQEAGAFVIEKKAGLWLVPLLVLSGPLPAGFSPLWVVRVFAVTVTAAAVFCLGAGTLEWWQTEASGGLFHHELSNHIGMNAIYLSSFLLVSLLVVVQWLASGWKKHNPVTRAGLCLGLLIQLPVLVLLGSKTLLLALFLFGNASMCWFVFRSGQWKRGLLIFLLGNTLLVGSVLAIPEIRERFTSLFQTEQGLALRDDYRHDAPFTGLSLRVVIWQIGFEVLDEHQAWALGTGPGDSQDLLNESYRNHGLYTGNPNIGDTGYLGYNLHSQWVQTLVDLGIAGLVLLLLAFGWLLLKAWRERNWLAGLFLVMFACFSLTESTLEAHHGSVFFALIISLLMTSTSISIPPEEARINS